MQGFSQRWFDIIAACFSSVKKKYDMWKSNVAVYESQQISVKLTVLDCCIALWAGQTYVHEGVLASSPYAHQGTLHLHSRLSHKCSLHLQLPLPPARASAGYSDPLLPRRCTSGWRRCWSTVCSGWRRTAPSPKWIRWFPIDVNRIVRNTKPLCILWESPHPCVPQHHEEEATISTLKEA